MASFFQTVVLQPRALLPLRMINQIIRIVENLTVYEICLVSILSWKIEQRESRKLKRKHPTDLTKEIK